MIKKLNFLILALAFIVFPIYFPLMAQKNGEKLNRIKRLLSAEIPFKSTDHSAYDAISKEIELMNGDAFSLAPLLMEHVKKLDDLCWGRDARYWQRLVILETVGFIGEKASPVLPDLIQGFKSTITTTSNSFQIDIYTYTAYGRAIAKIGKKALPFIERELDFTDAILDQKKGAADSVSLAYYRKALLAMLGERMGEKASSMLVRIMKYLEYDDEELVSVSIYTLASIGKSASPAIPSLLKELQKKRSTKDGCLEALKKIEIISEPVVEGIIEVLDSDEDKYTQRKGREILISFGREAIPILKKIREKKQSTKLGMEITGIIEKIEK